MRRQHLAEITVMQMCESPATVGEGSVLERGDMEMQVPVCPRDSEGQSSGRGHITTCLTGNLGMNVPPSMTQSLGGVLDREMTHFFVVVLSLLNVLYVRLLG